MTIQAWREEREDNGTVVYVNGVTNERTYERPITFSSAFNVGASTGTMWTVKKKDPAPPTSISKPVFLFLLFLLKIQRLNPL